MTPDRRISVRRHWVNVTVFCLLSIALCLRAAGGGGWQLQGSPSLTSNQWVDVTGTGVFINVSQYFFRLALTTPAGTTYIPMGGIAPASVTNATGSLSNGIGHATITVSSNDWATMTSGAGIHSNLWEVTITHQ